jgi:hypothetical protein
MARADEVEDTFKVTTFRKRAAVYSQLSILLCSIRIF